MKNSIRRKDRTQIMSSLYSANNTVKKLRDSRLRDFYGVRYDYRKNLADWDYTNRVKEAASIIHLTQYRQVEG